MRDSDCEQGYHFKDFFDVDELQKIQDLFSKATGVASIITKPDGTPITKPSGFSCFCNEIVRKTEKGLKNCMHSDSVIGCPNTEGPRIQRCLSGGLIDAGASIMIGDLHIANWLVGQVLDEDCDLEALLNYADEIGVDRKVYREALSKVNRMSRQQFESICNFLFLTAQQLSKLANENLVIERVVRERTSELVQSNSLLEETNAMLEETTAELEEVNATLEEEIEERFRAEEKIKKLNEDLEKKVIERTEMLKKSLALLEITFDTIMDAILIVDRNGSIVDFNQKFLDLWSLPSNLVALKNRSRIMEHCQSLLLETKKFLFGVQQARTNEAIEIHDILEFRDGKVIERYSRPQMVDGAIMGRLWCFRDITERHNAEQHMKYLSTYDTMTDFYNRYQFELKLAELEEKQVENVGIIVCDIDGLKFINDTFGHRKGDRHIVHSANIIRRCFVDNDFLYRIGGDEFVIVMLDSNISELEEAAKRIQETVSHPENSELEFVLNISIGFAFKDGPHMSIEEVFHTADKNMYKEKLFHNRSSRGSIVRTMAKMLEVRDFVTEGHARRLQELMVKSARQLGIPDYKISDIALFAELHDIGKNGIPDQILFKKGPLTREERREMETHSEIGYRIAISTPEIDHIADWILKHHEWWNGNGYPLKLREVEIPLECRLLSIVDAYDAMTNDRPYRKAMSHLEAVTILRECAGTQFDPNLVESVIKILENHLRESVS